MARLLPAFAHPLPHHAYAHHALSSLQPETRPLVKCCTSTGQLFIIFMLSVCTFPLAWWYATCALQWLGVTDCNQDQALAYTGRENRRCCRANGPPPQHDSQV